MGNKRFAGKVAWITGGGSGIGQALAVEFARQGARVAVSGRRKDRLSETVEAIEHQNGHAVALACDVTKEKQIAAALQGVMDQLGRLDVVVANAGYAVCGKFERITTEQWRRQLDVNVVGLAATVRTALPELRKTSGRIGLIGSVSGLVPMPHFSPYCASKAAVRAIGQVLAMELGTGVSCTTIEPGYVDSEIYQVDNNGEHHPERKDKRKAQLVWSADRAARAIASAIYARKREVIITGHAKLVATAGKYAPGLVHLLVTRLGAIRRHAGKVAAARAHGSLGGSS